MNVQIQLPDEIYYQVKEIAEQNEWSFAEVVRRGLKFVISAYSLEEKSTGWKIPVLDGAAFHPDFDRLDLKYLSESGEERGI